jgi:hypothetical protein
VGVFLPPLTDARLPAIEAEVGRADRSAAAALLTQLDSRRWVALFAPHAWVAIQKARLHLRLGDGRAAAKCLSEAARMTGALEHPALVGSQAHALTLSGDRKDAKDLLASLEQRETLTPRDRLNLGIAYVEDPGKSKRAITHLERAREVLGDHPRLLAALALAYARGDAIEQARTLLDLAEASEGVDADGLAPELIKRAKKVLRPALAEEKKQRKGGKRKAGSEPALEGTTVRSPAKKKDKRRERRRRRKGSTSTSTSTSTSKPTLTSGLPPVRYEGDEPLFRAPPLPPAPELASGRGGKIRPPVPAPPVVGARTTPRPPKVGDASATDDAWADFLGDSAGPGSDDKE